MKVVKSEKPSKKEVKDFQSKWKEHKANYIKDHSIEEMVYENGSALALLYKEVQRLNTNLMTILNKEENAKEDN
jgi:chemotaxis regulatin CheY-phosphate phosphatase CheZ